MDKEALKDKIYGSELLCLGIIANGLVYKKSKLTVFASIRKELVRLNANKMLNSIEINQFWLSFRDLYYKISKDFSSSAKNSVIQNENYRTKLENRRITAYQSVQKYIPDLIKMKNTVANTVENREKQLKLQELLSSGVFFLCSSHIKPAEDHAKWEGKVYVSEDWEARIDDEHIRARVGAYIRNRNIKTVEWVVGKPVYLVSRPNCHHYLKRVETDEVLNSSAKRLLKRHEMYMADKIPESYSSKAYKGYYERYKALLTLNSVCPNSVLSEDIQKVRKLMRIWGVRARAERKAG